MRKCPYCGYVGWDYSSKCVKCGSRIPELEEKRDYGLAGYFASRIFGRFFVLLIAIVIAIVWAVISGLLGL
jgi:uncharacterized membrane protein YvbJ